MAAARHNWRHNKQYKFPIVIEISINSQDEPDEIDIFGRLARLKPSGRVQRNPG